MEFTISVDRIEADDLSMPWQHRRRFVETLHHISPSEHRITDLTKAPEFRSLRAMLESIPGVELITAAAAIAKIDGFSRFPHRR